MKRLIAVLTGLVLLFGVAACAEEALPYFETRDQDILGSRTLLSEASYPQVCISPYGASFIESDYKEPWFVTFPGPEGTSCFSFDASSCSYLDEENVRAYYYEAGTNTSYEIFLNRCEDESNILLDGSDKVAAYISPDHGNAYGLIGLDEIERGAKLYIQISVFRYNKMEEGELKTLLTDLITAEVTRIKDSMACTKVDQYWTVGAYQGLKLFSYTVPGMTVVQEFPEITFHFDGQDLTGKMFITGIDAEKYSGYVAKDELAVSIQGEINSYSHVFYNREESEYTMVTLDDGSEWGIYVANANDGKPWSVYASRVLLNKDDRPLYFTFQLTAKARHGNVPWADVDAFAADLNTLAQSVQFEGLPE